VLESCGRVLQHCMLQISARNQMDPVPSVAAVADVYTSDVAGKHGRLQDLPYHGVRGLCLQVRKGTCNPGRQG